MLSPEKGGCEDNRPLSRTRVEEKWVSTVFAEPIIEESRRKKLEKPGAGTVGLFGTDRVDYGNKSNNINIIGRKPEVKKWAPVRKEKTAEQRKNEELHGRSVTTYGVGSKKDGTLMTSGADWKNP